MSLKTTSYIGKTWLSYSEHTQSNMLGSNISQSSDLPMKRKGISPVLPSENTDVVSNDLFPGQADEGTIVSSFAMENLKEQRKSESNLQIHPSFTHRTDHGEEGIKPLIKTNGEKSHSLSPMFLKQTQKQTAKT